MSKLKQSARSPEEALCIINENADEIKRFVQGMPEISYLSYHDKEDVFQNVFLKLQKSYKSYKSGMSINNWVSCIIRSQAVDVWRKNKSFHIKNRLRVDTTEECHYDNTLSLLEIKDHAEFIGKKISEMPEPKRSILWHYATGEKSIRDIVRLVPGVSHNKVYRTIVEFRERFS